jgi:hypothetical protein
MTMTLALAITFNAVLMLALLGGLVLVMSRAARLRPHVPAGVTPVLRPVALERVVRPRQATRPSTAFAGAGA